MVCPVLVSALSSVVRRYIVTKPALGRVHRHILGQLPAPSWGNQVFLAGVATSIGVESTARSAYDHGYNVVLVVDARADRDADSHRHSVEKILPRLGETDTTDSALKLLKSF